MNDRATGVVWGAFVADALALGVHWVYNTSVIDKKFGTLNRFENPLTSYHKGKKAGDFTHYGDQMMVVLETIAAGGFDLDRFSQRWQAFFATYDGYFDKATKTTLENLAAKRPYPQCGSSSDDLGGAARIAPLVFAYRNDPGTLVTHARDQSAFSHNHPLVIDAAQFFSLTAITILQGIQPCNAIAQVLTEHPVDDALKRWVQEGLDSAGRDTRTVISEFGQACAMEAAFPSTIHLIAKYEDNFEQALVANVMAGGDSAARGMLAGMLLGAYHGSAKIPADWLDHLNAREHIAAQLGKLNS